MLEGRDGGKGLGAPSWAEVFEMIKYLFCSFYLLFYLILSFDKKSKFTHLLGIYVRF